MKTLLVRISEEDFVRYGFDTEALTFDQLMDRTKRVLALQALEKLQAIARESGLSEITEEEIKAEISAVRTERQIHKEQSK